MEKLRINSHGDNFSKYIVPKLLFYYLLDIFADHSHMGGIVQDIALQGSREISLHAIDIPTVGCHNIWYSGYLFGQGGDKPLGEDPVGVNNVRLGFPG